MVLLAQQCCVFTLPLSLLPHSVLLCSEYAFVLCIHFLWKLYFAAIITSLNVLNFLLDSLFHRE